MKLLRQAVVRTGVGARDGALAVRAFVAFFSVLASYFLLLPLREEAALQLGTDTLPKLFTASLLVTLVVAPIASSILSRPGGSNRAHGHQHLFMALAAVLLVLQRQRKEEHRRVLKQQRGFGASVKLTNSGDGFYLAFTLTPLPQLSHASSAYQVNSQLFDESNTLALPARHLQQHQGVLQHPSQERTKVQRQRQLLAYNSPHATLQQEAHLHGHHDGSPQSHHQQLLLSHDLSPEQQPHQGQMLGLDPADTVAQQRRHRQLLVQDRHEETLQQQPRQLDQERRHQQRSQNADKGQTGSLQAWTLACFYVWHGVQNLVAVSALWALCAEVFTPDAGSRLFGFLSAGATAGQLGGSLLSMVYAQTARRIVSSSAGLPILLLPASALLMLVAARSCHSMGVLARASSSDRAAGGGVSARGRWSGQGADDGSAGVARASAGMAALPPANRQLQPPGRPAPLSPLQLLPLHAGSIGSNSAGRGNRSMSEAVEPGSKATATTAGVWLPDHALLRCQPGCAASPAVTAKATGIQTPCCGVLAALDGFRLILASPFLLLLCLFLMAGYMVSSVVYFERALVVSATMHDSSQRTAFFASLNSCSATIIFALQLFATGALMRRLGVTAALCLGPAVSLVGVALIAAHPSASVIAEETLFLLPCKRIGVEVTRKIIQYTLSRPTRELIFTVMSREEQYKAKVVIDSVVQRLGDALAAAFFQVLDVQLALGPSALAIMGTGVCVVWVVVALQLGRLYSRRAAAVQQERNGSAYSV